MAMKMARPSKADMAMALTLTEALERLGGQWNPIMPKPIEELGEGESDEERFDESDDAQCGRALRYLLGVLRTGSLSRVIYSLDVLLSPENRLLDPDADTLEYHPRIISALAFIDADETRKQGTTEHA